MGREKEPTNDKKEHSGESGKEQTPEEILTMLESAIEKQSKVQLTVSDLDGKSERIAIVDPMEVDGGIVWLGAKEVVFPVELSLIKKIELYQ